MVKRAVWLSITPEPERELPAAVATLAARAAPSREAVERERARIEGLVLHGSQRRWLSYLHEVVDLIDRSHDHEPAMMADVAGAREHAAAVIANHHNLLLALPGPGARLTARDRDVLARLVAEHERDRG